MSTLLSWAAQLGSSIAEKDRGTYLGNQYKARTAREVDVLRRLECWWDPNVAIKQTMTAICAAFRQRRSRSEFLIRRNLTWFLQARLARQWRQLLWQKRLKEGCIFLFQWRSSINQRFDFRCNILVMMQEAVSAPLIYCLQYLLRCMGIAKTDSL